MQLSYPVLEPLQFAHVVLPLGYMGYIEKKE